MMLAQPKGVYLENTIAQLVLDYIEMVVGLAV
jgi:hypothetical protein